MIRATMFLTRCITSLTGGLRSRATEAAAAASGHYYWAEILFNLEVFRFHGDNGQETLPCRAGMAQEVYPSPPPD